MDRKKLLIILPFIFVLALGIFLTPQKQENDMNCNTQNEMFKNEFENNNKNQISYKENVTIEELKKDVGIKINDDIYELQTEYDGRKIITVKNNLKFEVAFCGMIKNEVPKIEELDNIFRENIPQENGIWIEKNSRNKIIEVINNSKNTNSKYDVNGEGYLYILEKNIQTDLDKKIENAINDNKLNILTKSSICYIVDTITGEILDYNYEKMDRYQTYEYFEDNDKKIIFITENSYNQLDNEKIMEDVIYLF